MSAEELINPGASAEVSTLDDIKKRLQARRERDVTKLPRHHHKALGTVYIGYMPVAGYHAVEAAEISPGGNYNDWPEEEKLKYHANKRDAAFLKYGVVTADNKRLDDEVIALLQQGDYGAENRKLINAIQKQNPPREMLVEELRVTHSFDSMTCVFLRILERAGALEKVRDFLLADKDSEEAKVLSEDLRKWEETLPVFEALLDAKKAAKAVGAGIYERMEEVLAGGDAGSDLPSDEST